MELESGMAHDQADDSALDSVWTSSTDAGCATPGRRPAVANSICSRCAGFGRTPAEGFPLPPSRSYGVEPLRPADGGQHD